MSNLHLTILIKKIETINEEMPFISSSNTLPGVHVHLPSKGKTSVRSKCWEIKFRTSSSSKSKMTKKARLHFQWKKLKVQHISYFPCLLNFSPQPPPHAHSRMDVNTDLLQKRHSHVSIKKLSELQSSHILTARLRSSRNIKYLMCVAPPQSNDPFTTRCDVTGGGGGSTDKFTCPHTHRRSEPSGKTEQQLYNVWIRRGRKRKEQDLFMVTEKLTRISSSISSSSVCWFHMLFMKHPDEELTSPTAEETRCCCSSRHGRSVQPCRGDTGAAAAADSATLSQISPENKHGRNSVRSHISLLSLNSVTGLDESRQTKVHVEMKNMFAHQTQLQKENAWKDKRTETKAETMEMIHALTNAGI